MLLFFANIFNKVYGYAIIVGLFFGALLYSYNKGRRDSFNEAVRRTLEDEVATRREADDVRRGVDGSGNVADRLRRWAREGR